jgi:hypothetical protein
MRLVFVADEIPRELLRIVEFLNARMSPTEVVAIELRQFVSGPDQVVAPRVLGESVAASDRKGISGATGSKWSASDVREALALLPPEASRASLEIFDWLEANARAFGGGATAPSVRFSTGLKERPRLSVSVFTDAGHRTDSVSVNWLSMTSPEMRAPLEKLAQELRAIPRLAPRLEGLEADDFARQPSIHFVGILDAPGASTLFVAALKRFDERTMATPVAA